MRVILGRRSGAFTRRIGAIVAMRLGGGSLQLSFVDRVECLFDVLDFFIELVEYVHDDLLVAQHFGHLIVSDFDLNFGEGGVRRLGAAL